MNGFQCFPQDQGSQSERGNRVSPRFVPDGVHYESGKRNPSHVTTEGRFRSTGLHNSGSVQLGMLAEGLGYDRPLSG